MAVPSADSMALIAKENQYGAQNYAPLDVVCSKGEGVFLFDVDGNKYMDFLAAYSAVNQGHNHPRIAEAMICQIRKLNLTSRAFRNDAFPPLLEKMCKMTGFDKALMMNSGAEAVETAIKAIRKWAYEGKGVEYPKAEIIVAEGNFHGRTTTIVGFSTDSDSNGGFGPFTPGFKIVPFGDISALEKAIAPNTAAIFIEPIQGEGGVITPPKGYLKALRKIADSHKCLLVLDEIQSGLGRTGKMFAFEHEGIRPDGVTIGKALSGGFYPISAFLASKEVMDVFAPGTHGSTYGGNPLACAVASAALDVLADEKLIEHSAELGIHFERLLRGMKTDKVQEIRCLGLWAGIQLKQSAGKARPYCYELKDRGILCKDTHEQTIRLAPPLTITKDQLEWAVGQIAETLG
jgi:ornithine--oxo-acid transaminase